MALAKWNSFLFHFVSLLGIEAAGTGAFGKPLMIGAAIFEFDFALLNPGFLDFKLGQDRIRANQQPNGKNRGRSDSRHYQLRPIPRK